MNIVDFSSPGPGRGNMDKVATTWNQRARNNTKTSDYPNQNVQKTMSVSKIKVTQIDNEIRMGDLR